MALRPMWSGSCPPPPPPQAPQIALVGFLVALDNFREFNVGYVGGGIFRPPFLFVNKSQNFSNFRFWAKKKFSGPNSVGTGETGPTGPIHMHFTAVSGGTSRYRNFRALSGFSLILFWGSKCSELRTVHAMSLVLVNFELENLSHVSQWALVCFGRLFPTAAWGCGNLPTLIGMCMTVTLGGGGLSKCAGWYFWGVRVLRRNL